MNIDKHISLTVYMIETSYDTIVNVGLMSQVNHGLFRAARCKHADETTSESEIGIVLPKSHMNIDKCTISSL